KNDEYALSLSVFVVTRFRARSYLSFLSNNPDILRQPFAFFRNPHDMLKYTILPEKLFHIRLRVKRDINTMPFLGFTPLHQFSFRVFYKFLIGKFHLKVITMGSKKHYP